MSDTKIMDFTDALALSIEDDIGEIREMYYNLVNSGKIDLEAFESQMSDALGKLEELKFIAKSGNLNLWLKRQDEWREAQESAEIEKQEYAKREEEKEKIQNQNKKSGSYNNKKKKKLVYRKID